MKIFIKRSFILLTCATAALYFIGSLTPFISPVYFWPITFFGLAFPYFALAMVLLLVTWIFVSRKRFLFLLVIFLPGYLNLAATIGLHFGTSFQKNKPPQTIRVLSWNVNNFSNSWKSGESPEGVRRQMLNYIKKMNADILLLQEVAEYENPGLYSNMQALDSLGYHYRYFTRDITNFQWSIKTTFGSAILSKTPITDSGKILYEHLPVPESVAFATIPFGRDTLDFYTTHLVSMRISRSSFDSGDTFYPKYDSVFSFKKPVYQRLAHYDSLHAEQAHQIERVVNKSRHPVVISGDLNSVPTSYVYHLLSRGKKDVFLQKGFGLGKSYRSLSPTLRIDYIFTSKSIQTVQCTTEPLKLSDHYPVVADISF